MDQEQAPWWGLAWWLWALACLAVAVVYLVINTEGAAATGPGWRSAVLRWGHSLCWLLLAASFVVRMTPFFRVAGFVAAAGGLVYLGFLVLRFFPPQER